MCFSGQLLSSHITLQIYYSSFNSFCEGTKQAVTIFSGKFPLFPQGNNVFVFLTLHISPRQATVAHLLDINAKA
ncbi:hypothetical protein ACMD2_16666 [Ananas comosus]|uniref:Uncharacterized protein n=1 Tax=Ananas comosus TaxID=4615 RepID=A0A199VY47_ANACO|nr:hypothetical protein ACMD2_16666 [Ananas comosus]